MVKISLDFLDNVPIFITNTSFILMKQEETFKETSTLICISTLKKEKRYSEDFL